MLKELHIKNIAVIDEVHMEFSDGFNVLTGETGAGKSILIDSINMALGKRVSHDLLRTGCEKATVNAFFEVSDPSVLEKIEDLGIDCEDGIVSINRQLTADGKSTCRINGMILPLNVVKEISSTLIDIHGQNDNQSLLDTSKHTNFLDSFGNTFDTLKEYRAVFQRMSEIKGKIAELSESSDEKEHRLELLNFQINEINSAKLLPLEDEELASRREYLINAENIASGAGAAYGALYGGEEVSAYDLLRRAERSLGEISHFLPALSENYERLSGIIAETEDIASEINRCLEGTSFNVAELDFVEERLDTINTLKRKYGSTIEEILEYAKKAEIEASSIEHSDETLKEQQAELESVRLELQKHGEQLTKERKSAAELLEKRISAELSDLDMPKVRFSISISDRESENGISYTESGKDSIEFLLSTNPGEDLKPMSKIASGGELSRIMLAIKTVLSGSESLDTMIFDEIDTGVSGRAAQKIAEKLSNLARSRQVFSITHLAQIASMADSHYLIEKTSTETSTSTSVTKLDTDGRVRELARIIGGVTVTDLTRQSALEMLELAKNKKEI